MRPLGEGSGGCVFQEVVLLALRYSAYGAFLLSGLAVLLLLEDFFIPYIGAAISLALAGILLLAIDRGLKLLEDIRDNLKADGLLSASVEKCEMAGSLPRSIGELAAEIERAKSKGS